MSRIIRANKNNSNVDTNFAERCEKEGIVASGEHTGEINFYNRVINIGEDSRYYRLGYTMDDCLIVASMQRICSLVAARGDIKYTRGQMRTRSADVSTESVGEHHRQRGIELWKLTKASTSVIKALDEDNAPLCSISRCNIYFPVN